MKLSIKHRIPDLQRQVRQLVPINRKAVRSALNRTLVKGRESVYAAMRANFRNPVPYTLNALRVDFVPTTGKLEGRVSVKGPEDIAGGGIPAQSYLRPQILGGARRWKRSESLFHKKGILPTNWYMTPGPACRLDAYGNWSRSQILHLLAYFQAFPPQTRSGKRMRSNTSSKTLKRFKTGTRARLGFRYFVQLPGDPGRKPGIWQVQGNTKAQGPVGRPRLVVHFVSSPRYRKRLDFFGELERVAAAEMPGAHAAALQSMPLQALLPDVKVTL